MYRDINTCTRVFSHKFTCITNRTLALIRVNKSDHHTWLYINTLLLFFHPRSKDITLAYIKNDIPLRHSIFIHLHSDFIHFLVYLLDISERLGVWSLGLSGFLVLCFFSKEDKGLQWVCWDGGSFDPHPASSVSQCLLFICCLPCQHYIEQGTKPAHLL